MRVDWWNIIYSKENRKRIKEEKKQSGAIDSKLADLSPNILDIWRTNSIIKRQRLSDWTLRNPENQLYAIFKKHI